MRSYLVEKRTVSSYDKTVLTDPVWEVAERATLDIYPWYEKGNKQATTASVLYDEEALYFLFRARDRYSSAEPRELNGGVCFDSCVEFFASPFPEESDAYFNLEVNCCGALHLSWGDGMGPRTFIDAAGAAQVTIITSLDGPTKEPQSDDSEWRVFVRLPLKVLEGMAGRGFSTTHDWKCNFYRCGGSIDPQYACWNLIDCERPNFHKPEFFGTMSFARPNELPEVTFDDDTEGERGDVC